MMKLSRSLDQRLSLVFANGLHLRLHNILAFAGLAMVLMLVSGLSLSLGATELGFGDMLASLFSGEGTDAQSFAIWDVRLPRLLLGFMAGWCVALAGAMLQSLAQNPLAEPGLLGLSQGSILAIALLLVFFPHVSATLFPAAGLVGALAVGLVLMLLVGRSHAGGLPVLLMGIALETVLSSITMILILYTTPETSFALATWMAGSLFNSSWSAITGFLPWFALSLPAILIFGRALRSYDLGDQMAMSLGEPVARSRPILLLIVIILTSATAAAVGPLSFLGIMAPHIAGFLSPASGRARLMLAAMTGGLIVVAADTLTRTGVGDVGMSIGLSIIIIGAPLFITILRLRAMRASHIR